MKDTKDNNKSRGELIRKPTACGTQPEAEKQQRRRRSQQLDPITPQTVHEDDKYISAAVDAAKIGVYSNNLQTGETNWSPTFLKIYGLGPKDQLPMEKGIPKAVHPEDLQRLTADIESRLGKKLASEYCMEYRIILPNKKIRRLMDRGRLDFDRQDRPLRIHGIVMDITQRKHAEELWVNDGKQYRVMIESANSIIIRCDAEGSIHFINDYGLEFLGYSSEELIGRNLKEIIPQLEKNTVRSIGHPIKKITEDSNPYISMSRESIRKDGKRAGVIWSNTAILDEKGDLNEILIIGNDIPLLHQSEIALRENEARLRALSDNPPLSLVYQIETGVDGQQRRITYISAGIERLHGISADEVLKDSAAIYGQIIPEDRDRFDQLEAAALANLTQFNAEMRVRLPSGEIRWMFVTSAPRKLPNNHIIWDGVEVDITERKQKDLKQLKSERRVQQIAKNESLSLMAGAVAHHYNNMLQIVLGNIELAGEYPLPRKERLQFLCEAKDAAHRAVALSKMMLTFLGQNQGKLEYVDLSRICEANLYALQEKIPAGITLKTNLPKPGPVIKTDPGQIKQILTHLITNAWEAIKTTPGVVQVTVKTTNRVHSPENCCFPIESKSSERSCACLTVSDTGCGMTPNTINRIFDPFFTKKFTGRGLGLPVTLGIVKSHDGCIEVESTPGHGSTFNVYLPL